MIEPKPIASLSSNLLARKGDARPAIRRAHVSSAAIGRFPLAAQGQPEADPNDDLGWNDMGDAAAPVVRQQQERIARSFPAANKPSAGNRAVVSPSRAKAAFTLRLDAERHLRLRLASALDKRSAQQIVTEALDAFLSKQPGLECLVAQARKTSAK